MSRKEQSPTAPPPRDVRGVEHLGVTVPDVDAATAFLIEAFGATVLYDLVSMDDDGFTPSPPDVLQHRIGVLQGTSVRRVRTLRLAGGPNLELFEFDALEQRGPARPNDFGIQHFSLLVDDVHAVAERVRRAGGELLEGPNPLPGLEAGDGNLFWYTRTPWGSYVELVEIPSAQAYEQGTDARRWLPQQPIA